MYKLIKKTIDWQVNKLGRKKFVIYPFGGNGIIAKEILNNEYGIKEIFIVDQIKSKSNFGIKDINFLKNKYEQDEELFILLTVHMGSKFYLEVHQQISDFVDTERIIDVFSISTFYNPWKFYEKFAFTDVKFSIIEAISREIYKNGIDGEIAEAGVYKGGTAMWMNRLFPNRKLYLFDTFEGFDERDKQIEEESSFYYSKLDFSDTNEGIVLNKMIYPQNCIIKKGWFPESAVGIKERFCFVRLDMDLYNPIYEGLNYFYDKMVLGGYICVHDCRSMNFEGARKAVEKFCDERELGYVCMPDELGTVVIPIKKGRKECR